MATLQTVASFDGPDGTLPLGGLTEAPDGDLFGTTYDGNTVYEIEYNSVTGYASTVTTLATLNDYTGGAPHGDLLMDANGDLFGTTESGGEYDVGGVFELVNTATGYATAPTPLVIFNIVDGQNPQNGLVADAAGDLFGVSDDTIYEIANSASGYVSTPETLATFPISYSPEPNGPLIIDANGDLFGTMVLGGTNQAGSVFELANTPTGYADTVTTLASFNGSDGAAPAAGLVMDADGDLFGTTIEGGADNDGTVFEIVNTPSGYASTPITLISFNGSDGKAPANSSLIFDATGDLYGTTTEGGAFGDGTVFEIPVTATGYANKPITLASFDGADGETPDGTLTFGANGDLFGTTQFGGVTDQGTAFEIIGDTITNTVAEQPDIDAAPIDPFASVQITNFNITQADTITITQSNIANGTLFDPNAASDGSTLSDGVYTVIGSAPAVTADLNALVFDTTGIPGQTFVTGFTITYTDAAGETITDTTTSVVTSGVPLSPPAIGTLQNASYDAGDAAVVLDPDLSLGDPESDTCYAATVTIGAGFQGPGTTGYDGDELNLGATFAGIDASYDALSGVLTLSGAASLAEYQAALESVTFTSGQGDPTLQDTDDGRTINWSIDDGITAGSATTSLSIAFANNPTADVMWENADGQFAVWQMVGLAPTASSLLGAPNGQHAYAMAAGGFFPGDTHDLVGQNESGTVLLWQINGPVLLDEDVLTADPGISWHIRGAADFYNDGNTDILWQNDSGQVAIWDLSGDTLVNGGLVGNPGSDWLVKGAGDFFGDGNNDILLQNGNGVVMLWDMDGTSIIQSGTVDAAPGASWRIVGTGDFYGDGNTDILWQASNGELAIWDMSGTTIIQGGTVAANPGFAWHVVGTGNYNDDSNAGPSDILFQNEDGAVVSWEMDGTTSVAAGITENTGGGWTTVTNDTMLFIASGSPGETLTAIPTTPDEFEFTAPTPGAYDITGFNTVQDIIELSGWEFPTFAAVQAATTASGGGAVINIGNGATLTLAGVDPATLHGSNFALT